MTANEDLLSRYNREASQEAFTELVARHLHLVQGAALRIGNGDLHFAKDVTQVVFMDLAVNSARVKPGVPLAGWLYRHACFTAMKALRANQRRVAREGKAMTMMSEAGPEPSGEEVAARLDEAMLALPEEDRMALVLRYFQRCDHREVGRALGVGEDAAQKRVSRAVERLREALGARGCATTGAALAAALGAGIPSSATLAAGEISAAALGMASAAKLGLGAAASAGLGSLATGVASVGLAVSMAGALWWQGRELGRALESAGALSQELHASAAARAAKGPPLETQADLAELERLRRDNRDLHRLRAEVTELSRRLAETRLAAASPSVEEPTTPEPSPAEAAAPTQVVIEVKLVELHPEAVPQLRIPGIPGALGSHRQPIKAILSAEEYKQAMELLEASRGVDVLSAPRVTTLSGRQAQVSVRQTQHVVGLDENGVEQVEPLEVGPVVDIIPYIFAAGGPIRLNVISTVTGFDGYQAGKPLIRTHLAQADLAVARGEVLVIGGPNTGAGKGTDGPESRFVLTFLHAQAIDPAGNLIHP